MDSKSIFASKSFWSAILTPILSWAAAKYGFDLDAEGQAAVIAGATAIAAVIFRKVTDTPVHIVKPKE
jgi:hypothetical protein